MTQEFDKRFAEVVKIFLNDRLGFVRHIIGVEPTAQQCEVIIALDGNDFIAIKSGVNTGKTTLIAWMILHYMCTRPHCRIIATSPSKDQLRSVLWPELLHWHNKMNPIFRSQFVWQKESYVHKDYEDWFAVARTATKDNPEAMQGIHGKYVLRIKDEASGIPQEVDNVLEGATGTIETKELMCGNPTRLQGTFYRAFNEERSFYRLFSWSSLDSPIAPKRLMERIRERFGEDSNMYRVRVLGEFPVHDGDSYIPFDLVVAALNREIPEQKNLPKVFGVDVGDGGKDASVVSIRQGDKFYPYHVLNMRTDKVTDYVARLANREKPKAIFVDIIGYGKSVYDGLKRLGFGDIVIAVNVAESAADDPQRFYRLRDELWGKMRDWLELRCGSLWDNEDRDLLGELTTPKYHILEGSGKIKLRSDEGKIKIESKDEIRDPITKRKAPSTNIADSHLLTFASEVNQYIEESDAFYGDDDKDSYRPLDSEAGYVWLMPLLLPLMGVINAIM